MTIDEAIQQLCEMKIKHGGATRLLVNHEEIEAIEFVSAAEGCGPYVNVWG